jgi:hypothetical protein
VVAKFAMSACCLGFGVLVAWLLLRKKPLKKS